MTPGCLDGQGTPPQDTQGVAPKSVLPRWSAQDVSRAKIQSLLFAAEVSCDLIYDRFKPVFFDLFLFSVNCAYFKICIDSLIFIYLTFFLRRDL